MVNPFILHRFPFFLTDAWKGEKSLRGVDVLYGLYLLRHASDPMYVSPITSSVKMITKHIAAMYHLKLARMISCWDFYEWSWAVIC